MRKTIFLQSLMYSYNILIKIYVILLFGCKVNALNYFVLNTRSNVFKLLNIKFEINNKNYVLITITICLIEKFQKIFSPKDSTKTLKNPFFFTLIRVLLNILLV